MFRRLLSTTISTLTPSFVRPAPIRTMSSSPLQKPLKLALIQLQSGADKAANLLRAAKFVTDAAQSGAEVVVLPECFNSPYGCEHFPSYAEPIPAIGSSPPEESVAPSFHAMSALAKKNSIHLIAGSIPELVEEPGKKKYYNTCMVFSPTGSLLATHRKIHLFDIDIPGGITFRESDVLSPGSTPTLVDLPGYGKLGVVICYDIRFPELAMIAARKGAFAIVCPAAFNMTTGPLHWELLARARALDNMCYVAMCSPARVEGGGKDGKGYVAWGETMVVDPSGVVEKKLGAQEGVVEVVLKGERIKEVRRGIPIYDQRRWDVYADVSRVGPMEGEAKGEE